jgi:hypothetical protein
MTTIAEMEQHRAALTETVEMGDMAIRLFQNNDFQHLIMQEFCVKEAARYVQSSCDPALDAGSRADSLALAQASGHLKRWLSVTTQMANRARADIINVDEQLEYMRSEEA